MAADQSYVEKMEEKCQKRELVKQPAKDEKTLLHGPDEEMEEDHGYYASEPEVESSQGTSGSDDEQATRSQKKKSSRRIGRMLGRCALYRRNNSSFTQQPAPASSNTQSIAPNGNQATLSQSSPLGASPIPTEEELWDNCYQARGI